MVQLFTESQNGWIWMASPQVGSATAGCSGSCPMMETLEPAGTTCLRLTAKNVFLSLNSIPSISVGAHCLFSWHYWKQLQPLFLTLHRRYTHVQYPLEPPLLQAEQSWVPTLFFSPFIISTVTCWIFSATFYPFHSGKPRPSCSSPDVSTGLNTCKGSSP